MFFLILAMVDSCEELDKVMYVYLECEEDMRRVAYAEVKNMQDAEDVVSAVLLWIVENHKKMPEMNEKELKNYALRAVRNRAKNFVRQGKRVERLDGSDIADRRDQISELLDKEHDISVLGKAKACICRLEPIYYDVMSSVYIRGESIKFTAAKFGISCDTVRKRLSRGTAMLAKMLKEEGVI